MRQPSARRRAGQWRCAAAAALLVAASCSGPADPVAARDLAPAAAARLSADGAERLFLDMHNRERAAVGVPPLVWDDGLAAAAARYGPELVRLGRLVHSPAASRPGQGENLWMGTHAAYGEAAMFASWADEKRAFRPGRFPEVSTTGDWHAVGHYTQIIWRGTTRVGCAIQESAEWDYLICRYAPPGNVVGVRVP